MTLPTTGLNKIAIVIFKKSDKIYPIIDKKGCSLCLIGLMICIPFASVDFGDY